MAKSELEQRLEQRIEELEQQCAKYREMSARALALLRDMNELARGLWFAGHTDGDV